MHFTQEPDALEGDYAHQDVGVVGAHGVVLISGKYPFPGPQAYRHRQIPVCQERKCPRLSDIWMRGFECVWVSTAYFEL